jgi:hypothetical protein
MTHDVMRQGLRESPGTGRQKQIASLLVARKGQEKGEVGKCWEIGNCKSQDFNRLRMAVNDT